MVNPADASRHVPPGFLAGTPPAPYYAVVFTAIQRPESDPGYLTTAMRMVELVADQPGFLGIESAADGNGHEITVSYWQSLDDIRAWREQAEHRTAQAQGRLKWYEDYAVRVCRVEYDYTRQTRRAHPGSASGPSTERPTFEALAQSRKVWLDQTLRVWCRSAGRAELLKAEHDWINVAGRVDPAKTLWAWAWGRFPELVHEELGLDESVAVEVRLLDGRTVRGYPDARRSTQGRLILMALVDGRRADHGPFSIDEIDSVDRIRAEA